MVNAMPPQCPRCSRPIATTDVIDFSNGRMLHVDCRRPQTLTPAERSLIFVYCSEHSVARCPACDLRFRFGELAADFLAGRTNLCPRCRRDLTEGVRAHLFTCVTLPSAIRELTQAVRDAAQILIARAHRAAEADTLAREAEAHLRDRQQELRVAMAQRGTALHDDG